MGVKNREDLIALCEKAIEDNQAHVVELREQLSECGHKSGEVLDELDRADKEIERGRISHRIDHVTWALMRIRAVSNLLRNGWDGLCLDCGEVDVIHRIEAGYFTRRCCTCKTKREHLEAGFGKSAPGQRQRSYA